MVNSFSWDSDAARNVVVPSTLDTADHVHKATQPNERVLAASHGLGPIAHHAHQQVQEHYAKRQQWGASAHARLTNAATATVAATDAFDQHEVDSAAAINRGAEGA